MKLKTLLWIGAALVTVPFASGCGYDCTVMGCFAGIEVALVPSVSSTYDVELVLDGVVDAFTCSKTENGWSVGDSTEGVLSFGCDGLRPSRADRTEGVKLQRRTPCTCAFVGRKSCASPQRIPLQYRAYDLARLMQVRNRT